eukprot:scaffold36788_cov90-Phaeocystis_antarctica.AAC.3
MPCNSQREGVWLAYTVWCAAGASGWKRGCARQLALSYLLLACVAEERAWLGRRVSDPGVPQLAHVSHHEDVSVDHEH